MSRQRRSRKATWSGGMMTVILFPMDDPPVGTSTAILSLYSIIMNETKCSFVTSRRPQERRSPTGPMEDRQVIFLVLAASKLGNCGGQDTRKRSRVWLAESGRLKVSELRGRAGRGKNKCFILNTFCRASCWRILYGKETA